MKRFIRTVIWGLGIAAGFVLPLAQARDCGCDDLPVMLNELNEHEFNQKLFQSWADYLPRDILDNSDLKKRAEAEMNAAFYGNRPGSAGTTHGAHAALGTDVYQATCPILEYLYDKHGNKELNKDGTQKTRPTSEATYKTKQCSSRTKADFAHERVHEETCKRLVQSGQTQKWDSPTFFAGNDARAYKAGADVLRDEIKTLAGKCGWDNSTRNRLPNADEAYELAERASKARPKRRKK